jgi:hypothetical protein
MISISVIIIRSYNHNISGSSSHYVSMITSPCNEDNVIMLSWQGCHVIMITLSWFHERVIMLAWKKYYVIMVYMTGSWCYHDWVIMLLWYGNHVNITGSSVMMARLQCYYGYFIMLACYHDNFRLSIRFRLLKIYWSFSEKFALCL